MKKLPIIKKLISAVKGVAALGLVSCLTALPLMASSHAEAPLISMDRYADNTDVYAFRSYETGRTGFVTLIANYIPFQDPSGGPQFYRFDDSVLYEINIDNTGDGQPDLSYQFRFRTVIRRPDTVLGMSTVHSAADDGVIRSINDPDYNMPQFYSVTLRNHNTGTETVLANNVPMPPSNIGPTVTPNYEAVLGATSVHTLATSGPNAGTRVFAGQRDEGFFIDVGGVFDRLTLRSLRHDNNGVATLTPFNVNTIAIEVPQSAIARGGTTPASATADNAVVGIYATASRQTTRVLGTGTATGTQSNSGNFVQVSRLGNPLVNEVVIPLGLKDAFNGIRPASDGTIPQVVAALQDPELARLLQRVGAVQHIPGGNRSDIITIYATGIPNGTIPGFPGNFLNSDNIGHEMLRLNMGIAPTAVNPGLRTGVADGASELGLLDGDIAGFPNGRRVFDDIVDISLRVVAGGTPFYPALMNGTNNRLGDGVNFNEQPFLQRFPYLAPPNQGNQPRPANFPSPAFPSGTKQDTLP